MTRTDRNRIVTARRMGHHTCACGAPIMRARTSGDDRTKDWSANPDGRWWLHPVTGVMHPFDPDDQGDFDRFNPHSCILDALQ